MKRHDPDAVSLLFGLLFATLGLLLLGGDPQHGSISLGWVGPLLAIGIGALVLVAVRPPSQPPVAGEDRAADEGQPLA